MTRQEIELHLHPLSAKILKCDFGIEGSSAIYIPSSEPAYDLLFSARRRHAAKCDTPVTLLVSDKNVSPYAPALLYHYHKRRCFEYMLSHLDAGKPALQAMETWYKIYDIDDAYDPESMYREWTRYYKRLKTEAIYPTPSGQRITLTKPDHSAEDIAAHICAEHIDLFFNGQEKFDTHLATQMISYVHKVTATPLPKRVKERTYQYRVKKFRDILSLYPEVKETITSLM